MTNGATASASTPIELVQEVYGRLPERVALGRDRLGRGLTLAEKILVNHLRDASQALERGRSYNDFDPDRAAMQDATAQMALLQFMTWVARWPCRPPCTATTSSKPRRARRSTSSSPSTPTARCTSSSARVGEVRHRLLEAGQRDHPPGRAGELRLPWRDDDRHRQPHAQRRRARHGRHRRGRRRRRGRDDRLPVQRPLAEAHRRPPHRHAQRLVEPEGHHPQGRRDPHREGRHRRHHRVLRSGRRLDHRHRQGHRLQHGRRDRATTSLFAYDSNMAEYLRATGRAAIADAATRWPTTSVPTTTSLATLVPCSTRSSRSTSTSSAR